VRRVSIQLIILAAGQGTRMQSDRPKVLHEIGNAPLLHHAMRTGLALEPDRVVVVTGHGSGEVARAARAVLPTAYITEQTERLGTAHAVAQALPALSHAGGLTIVLYGDTPLIRRETLQQMVAAAAHHGVVVLGFEATDPGRYGRLVTNDEGTVARIVEWKDASPQERAIRLCNSGVICCATAELHRLVVKVDNDNAAGEYYLTDIVGIARDRGMTCGLVTCPEAETLGVNSRADLAAAEAAFQCGARAAALARSVTLAAPSKVHFSWDTRLSRDVTVEQNVVFGPGVTAESGATIRAFSHLEGCHVARGAVVGPYARLRPGTDIARDARIGNFVEVKSADIGEGAKVNHLSYVGDASVGARANIGAGTITCNYDGVFKHRTEIGPDAFIGSNTMLVAPVRVGAEAMTGSGSVITSDVEAGALGIGRARQVVKPGLGRRIMAMLRQAKARRPAGEATSAGPRERDMPTDRGAPDAPARDADKGEN
jgi:bifunctional UDP-N-acetylglucosamine pyrophosphorylase/glucosamine-1-phosphate N-acetyltransferase